MRYASKRKMRLALPALAAAGFSAWLGVPVAHGDLVVNPKVAAGTSVNGGADTDFVLTALNNGLNNSGTTLLSFDVTIQTAGTGTQGALLIQLNADITSGGDGTNDANIVGFPDQNGVAPTPTFGGANGGAGTFVGVPASTTGTKADTVAAIVDVEENGIKPADYDSANGPVDPNFLNGVVHNLRVVGAFAGTFKGPNASVTAVPFANIVVPTGTTVTVSGGLSGNTGALDTFSIVLGGGPTTTGPLIQLASTAIGTATNQIAPAITIHGSNGSYASQTVAVTGAAQTKGFLAVSGFNPTTDTEVYGLAATTSNLATLIQELNTAVGTADPGAVAEAVPAGLASTLAGDNIAVIFPSPTTPGVFSYDLTGDTTGAAITSITVVPEPTSVGALVLGGLGLLGRRKRRQTA